MLEPSSSPYFAKLKFRDQEELKFRVPSEFSTNDWEKHVQFQSWKLNANVIFGLWTFMNVSKDGSKSAKCPTWSKIKDPTQVFFLLGIDQPRYISLMKINECVFDQLPFLRTRFRDSTSSSELASRKPCCAGSGALPGRVKSTVFQPAWAVRRWDPKF